MTTSKKGTLNEVGMAGEFHVLAQLLQRGYSAHPTLGNTKGMDILVVDQETGHMLKVEVKTASDAMRAPTKRLWWCWTLSSRAEQIGAPNLVYCFVHLGEVGTLPRFFLVPSEVVAEQCSREHREWIAAGPEDRRTTRTDTAIRNFWFYNDENNYENNWEVLRCKLEDRTA
ncbi:hypothetical protein [Cyanobium sp. ATX 6F1]|uniref:hypothetical protein n=1 Tax=Cyanobium sp. ATX 6F1 TaxID=2823702 RepID=UPI0020CCE3A4|nr:hypothetical protein [Cyanobium sp. ATX 6F1]MCP9916245.1 hypothetical protein [Cyanobium sp. ATX 6F1]